MKTRTKAQIERGSELMQALCLIFYPYVEAALRPQITAQMSGPQPKLDIDDEGIETLKQLAAINAAAEGVPPEEIEKQLEKLEKHIRDPQPFDPEEIEEAVKEESQQESVQLVRNWLNAYFYADEDVNGNRTVPFSRIDDAMLPPLDFVLAHGFPDGQTGEEMFAECCNTSLDADATRAVLRQVKANLPFGWPMPLEAVAFLKLEDINIVP